jgi:hypothetical protein
LTGKCPAITGKGEPCKGLVGEGSDYCPAHDPSRQEARRRAASKAGKSRGASELAEVKREIRRVIEGVLDGSIERGIGAVAFQGFNTLLKGVETERRIKEAAELEERLTRLENRMGTTSSARSRRWG